MAMPQEVDVSAVEDDILTALDETHEPEAHEGRWKVTDRGGADWALRKLQRIEAEAQTIRADAQEQINAVMAAVSRHLAPIERSMAEELERLGKEREKFEALLEEYHRGRLAEDPRAKTIRLEHGQLIARQKPAEWQIQDEEFLAWAKSSRPELVRVKEEVDRQAAKKVLKPLEDADGVGVPVVDPQTGEPVPGVFVMPGERTYRVELGEVEQ